MASFDPEMLQLAQKGDRKAQHQFYREAFPVLMGVCMRYRRDEQEAVSSLNMGFLKILQHLDRIPPNVPLLAWMRRIMINTLIDEFRREKNWREHTVLYETLENEKHEQACDYNEADQRFNLQQLENMLRLLPPMTRQVFNLFAIDGFSHAEISTELGMSEGTSKWHVNNARKQLQALIRQELVRL